MVITDYICVLKRKPKFDLELLNLTNQVSIGVMMIKGSKIPELQNQGGDSKWVTGSSYSFIAVRWIIL